MEGYESTKKGMLESVEAFRAWQEEWLRQNGKTAIVI